MNGVAIPKQKTRKIKISTYDSKFSWWVRDRDGWRCQRCGRQFTPPTMGLHCAHFHGRGKSATRFLPDNCVSCCYGCHSYFDGAGRTEFVEFMKKRLGQKRYREVEILARSTMSREKAIKEFMGWYSITNN